MRSTLTDISSKPKTNWRPDTFACGMAMFLFASAVKPGTSTEFDSITYTGLVAFLRDHSQHIGIVGLLLLLFTWLRRPKLTPLQISYPALWFLIFKAVISLRIAIAPTSGIEQIISFISLTLLYFIMLAKDGSPGSERNYEALFKGMCYFAAAILLMNLYLCLFQYSTTSWKGRFVGVFQHPNFAGVNFAICASIIFGFNYTQKNYPTSKITNFISTILLITSALLIMATGSRTGILGFASATIGYMYIQNKIKPSTIFLLSCAAFITLLSLDSIIEVLAHNIPGIKRITEAGNTRDGVWVSMWDYFVANPLFGAGLEVKATAGSYLRVLSMGGLAAAIPLLICMLLCIKRTWRVREKFKFRNAWLPGLLCILVTSITEGYLADALSLGLIYFVLIVFVLSYRKPLSVRA